MEEVATNAEVEAVASGQEDKAPAGSFEEPVKDDDSQDNKPDVVDTAMSSKESQGAGIEDVKKIAEADASTKEGESEAKPPVAPIDKPTPLTPPTNTEENEGGRDSTAKHTQTTDASALKPEMSQNRQQSNGDKPSAYAPSRSTTYMQMKALALQMPNITAFAQQSSSHNVDPPVMILEARTNLSSARRSFYPRVTRSLPELQLWILALTLSFPAAIFSPFTYPPTTLATSASMDDVALRGYLATMTKQLTRILSKPYVLSHPATVALVDCDFSYNPGMPHVGPGSSVNVRRKLDEGMALARSGHDPLRGRRGKAGTGQTPTSSWDVDGVAAALGLPALPAQASGDTFSAPSTSSSKGPLSIFSRANASPQRIQPQPSVPIPPGEEDQDEEELTAARNEITRLELQFEKASIAANALVECNGAMTATLHQLCAALTDLAKLDEGRTVARKKKEPEDVSALTRGIEGWASAQVGAGGALMSTIVPSMSYQSMNARSAIDALLRRAAAATHRHSALVVLVQKRREAERLKRARGEIRQEDVDWVLQELRDAQRTTHVLSHHLGTFTSTLKEELKEHSRNTHTDIQDSLLQHAKSSIRAQKFLLSNIVRARDAMVAIREGKVVATQNGAVGTKEEGKDAIGTELQAEADAVVHTDADADIVEGIQSVVDDEEATTTTSAVKDISSNSVEEGDRRSSAEAQEAPGPVEEAQTVPEADAAMLSVPTIEERTSVGQTQPLLTPEPSPWAAKSPWGQDEPPPLSAPSSSWTIPPQPPAQPAVESSPWDEEAGQTETVSNVSNTAQSTFLPPRSANPFQDEDDSRSESTLTAGRTSTMSQSAFLPGRDMSRYANPFARMDGGGNANGMAPNLGGRPANVQQSGPYRDGPLTAGSGGVSAQTGRTPQQPGKSSKDPWANRSRISASDAARSLAGRF